MTVNTTNDDSGVEYSEVWQIIHSVFLIVVCAVGVLGNGFVCLAVFKFHHLQKAANYFLVSLAASDILVCLFAYPFRVYFELNSTWQLGRHTCQFYIFFDLLCCTASIVNLSLVSVDRYISLSRPLRYLVIMRAHRCYIGISSVWLFSFVLAILSLLTWSSDGFLWYQNTCYKSDKIYYTTSTILGILLPLLILIVLYCLVFKMALAHQKQIDGCTMGSFVGAPPEKSRGESRGGEPLSRNTASRRRHVATELKAAKTLIIVVGTFLVCWLPGFVIILVLQYSRWYIDRLPPRTQQVLGQIFLHSLPPLNSALNPFIYTYCNTEIRKVFKNMCWRLLTIVTCTQAKARRESRAVPV